MNERGVLTGVGRFVFVLMACTAGLIECTLGKGEPRQSSGETSGSATQEVHGGALINAVIVNYLRSSAKLPALRAEHELEWSVFGLLPLCDGLNDRESLKALVDLKTYYLGEAPDETLDCLLVRKGESVVSILSELKKTGSQGCRQRLGPKSTVCRSDDELRREVDIVLKRIGGKEACDIEQ